MGRTFPRDVAAALDNSELDDTTELEIDSELICRGFKIAEVEEEETEESAPEVGRVPGMKLRVVVDDGAALEIEAGMATGQKDHVLLPSSQYKSISNLRKPTASRLDKQSPEESSSYFSRGKQAAVKETPGLVTKLIGILNPNSLNDLEAQISTGGRINEVKVLPGRRLDMATGARLQGPGNSSRSFSRAKLDIDINHVVVMSTTSGSGAAGTLARSARILDHRALPMNERP